MTEDVLIKNIDQILIDKLTEIADEKGMSLEDYLRDLFTRAAAKFDLEESLNPLQL